MLTALTSLFVIGALPVTNSLSFIPIFVHLSYSLLIITATLSESNLVSLKSLLFHEVFFHFHMTNFLRYKLRHFQNRIGTNLSQGFSPKSTNVFSFSLTSLTILQFLPCILTMFMSSYAIPILAQKYDTQLIPAKISALGILLLIFSHRCKLTYRPKKSITAFSHLFSSKIFLFYPLHTQKNFFLVDIRLGNTFCTDYNISIFFFLLQFSSNI